MTGQPTCASPDDKGPNRAFCTSLPAHHVDLKGFARGTRRALATHSGGLSMLDVLLVVIALAFFALSWAYTVACEKV
jgi:hypothetical protein